VFYLEQLRDDIDKLDEGDPDYIPWF